MGSIMAASIQPTEFAQRKGLNAADFAEACEDGEQEYAGYPIGSWTVRDRGSVYLRVPDSVMESDGAGSSSQPRSNPVGKLAKMHSGDSETTWAEAAKETAPAVSANASGAYAVASMSEAVKENPEIAETIADTVALLGSGALGVAATEEGEDYRAAKVGGMTVAGFGIYKLIRHMAEQSDRRTDMAEREQRHQIQQENKQEIPKRRGDGASTPARSLTVTGSR